jgi:peptidoglycan/LPS O-acetylase OafA/YrhL
MYIVLAAASLLTLVGFLDGSLQPEAVFAQVAHLSNYYIVQNGWWDGRAPGTWIYWSLAVEEHFYLGFPLLYLGLRRFVPSRKRQFWILLATCGAILVWRMVLVFVLGAPKDRMYVASDTRVDSILFGCALAVFGNPALDPTRIGARWWKLALVPLSLVGLLASFLITNPQFEQTGRYTLQGVALFPLFVAAIRYPDWLPFRILNVGWVKFVGVLSYSFYLLHPTVLFAVFQWTPWHPIVQGVLGLAIALGLACAMYYLVELPCASLRRRLHRNSTAAEHERKRRTPDSQHVRDGSGPAPRTAPVPAVASSDAA